MRQDVFGGSASYSSSKLNECNNINQKNYDESLPFNLLSIAHIFWHYGNVL